MLYKFVEEENIEEPVRPSNFQKMFFVKKNNQTAMIDENGKIVIPYKTGGLEWCYMCGVIDENHQIYDYNGEVYSEGTFRHSNDGLEFYDVKSKKIIISSGGWRAQTLSEYIKSIKEFMPNYQFESRVLKIKNLVQDITNVPYSQQIDINTIDNDIPQTYALIKSDGTPLETIFDGYKNMNKNLAALKEGDQWGFVDNMGKYTMAFSFDDAFPFSDDSIAAVKKDDKWGYINTEGKQTVPFIFEDATTSFNGEAWVKYNGKWGVYQVK